MKKYFNVYLEFDPDEVDRTIHQAIIDERTGYVCSVERNVMATANNSNEFQKVVNNALINICDGNFVARCISIAHCKNYKTYIGADLFLKYVKSGIYKQYFLGNTSEVLDGLRNNLSRWDDKISEMSFETLPFRRVEDFNYAEIAKKINISKPDIIWVSLGAPKQEYFMSKLLPFLDKGVLFGFGAIFNFYAGDQGIQRAPNVYLKLKLEWLYRMMQEPKKNFQRNWSFLQMAPKLIMEEKKKIRKNDQ
ncbi:WecB/TagA/CpsF family glycosyltransferase [Akkermansiaceae bacterium]|nr:WecB/TagA/CpsF family glycosyltransferase [Akkermansiaceae bacterium]